MGIFTRTLPIILFTLVSSSGFSAESVTNLVYTEKGLAGKLVVEQTGENTYSGLVEVAWNNRRYNVVETLEVDKHNYPVKYQSSGTSPFGSAIEESFEKSGSVVRWGGNKDEGEKLSDGKAFYIPADGTVTDGLLVKALLASPDNSIELLPSGRAKLEKISSAVVENDGKSAKVHLYAISGLNFSPSYSWHDENGDFFATNVAGFIRIIREGYTLDNFNQLKDLQEDAENKHLRQVANRYSKTTPRLLIAGVDVVDVENARVLEKTDVLIERGKIAAIGKGLKVKGQLHTIDGKGKTLVPGLWDMHGHLSKNDGLLNIAAGVTSVRDIGNNHDNIMLLETLFNTGDLIGPNVYRAGFMDQQSEYSAGLSVNSLDEALQKVDWFADNGYLQIKLYSSIDPSWVKPISDRAHNRGLRVSGHIPAFMTAEQAINSGYDEIQHINMLFLNFLAGTKVDTRQRLRFSLVGEKAHSVNLYSKEVTAFLRLLKDKNIVVDPTVSTFRSLLVKQNKKIDEEFAAVADHLPPAVVRQLKGAEMPVPEDQWEGYQASVKALSEMIKLLHDNNIPIVPGTDNIAGFTLTRELELYSQAGIPNLEVLRIATLDCARLVGAAHYTGSITNGKVADMILVDGDPVKNIADLKKISLVIKGGQYFKPDELYGVLGVKPFTAGVTL